jgi:hypothetical protein
MTKRMMQQKKRIFSLILAIAMVVGIISPGSTVAVKAGKEYDGYVYVTVERFTLGQGLAAEPKKIGYDDGDTVEDILKRAYGEDSIIVSDGAYGKSFDGFVDGGEPEGWTTDDIPEKIIEALDAGAEGEYAPPAVKKNEITKRTKADTLANYDYTGQSYLMLCVDNKSAQYGISGLKNGTATDGSAYHDGSVIRIEYGIYNYGGDLNIAYGTPLIDFADKDELIRAIVDYAGNRDCKGYTDAVAVLEDWDATEAEVDTATENVKTLDKYSEAYKEVLTNAKEELTSPAYGNEWTVLSIARKGLSDKAWNDLYINSVEDKVKENGSNILHKTNSTNNSKIALVLNAVDKNPEDVSGYNLISPLANYDYVKKQGANGIIYALIALDSGKHEVPEIEGEGTQTTRELLINGILDARIADGGWNYTTTSKTSDPDLTGMAIQALAPYYKSNKKVKNAVDNALTVLSNMQNENGGYSSWGNENSCSCAQVICALTALGLNPDCDERFIKNGKSLLDATLAYYNEEDKGFKNSAKDTKKNALATQQVLYALTSLDLMIEDNSRLFMSEDHAHKVVTKDAKEPKCNEKGYTGDKVCVDCGEIVEKGQEIAAQGHKPVEIPAVAATETTAGKTAGKKCSVCGAIIEAQKDVPATGKKQETTQAPTTTAEAPKTVKDTYTVTSTDEKKQTVAYTGDDNSKAKKVTISDTVTDPDTKTTYKVTEVAENACKDNKNLTTVNIGKNVTKIGAGAFAGCTKLSKISVDGDSIKSIGKNAFSGIKKNATIKVSAKTKKQYKKIVKMIKKAGAKKAKFKFVKKTKKKATTKKK